MTVAVVNTAERSDLVDALWSLPHDWPTFMLHSPVANQFYDLLPEVFPEYQLVALDKHGEALGKIHSVPFVWAGTDSDLPARGWDAVLERAFADHARGAAPTAVSLLEAHVVPAQRGHGLSGQLLQAARCNAAQLGLPDLFGPVRPTGKAAEPRTPMTQYARRIRADGLPADPWIRTHVRLGARLVSVCPASMTIPGALADWRAWTGLPLAASGRIEVPGALTPVHVSVEQNHAVYVEPNVWVHHRTNAHRQL